MRAMMARVGLDPAWINRYPHELSGGQNQRVGIARAMILRPRLVVCDEAVCALDVSIQAQIIALIGALQAETGLSLIFISHDLAVVRRLSHRVMVLYLGRVVELAPVRMLYARPAPSLYQGAALRRAGPRSPRRAGPKTRASDRRPALAAGPQGAADVPQIPAGRTRLSAQTGAGRARPLCGRARLVFLVARPDGSLRSPGRRSGPATLWPSTTDF